jgi:hypothetical protein
MGTEGPSCPTSRRLVAGYGDGLSEKQSALPRFNDKPAANGIYISS